MSPPGQWNNFVQTHVTGGAAQSPWQMNLIGDQADLKLRILAVVIGARLASQQAPFLSGLSLGSLPKNQWNDFVAVFGRLH